MSKLPFGASLRGQDFIFRKGVINLDQHGSPVYPQSVLDAKISDLSGNRFERTEVADLSGSQVEITRMLEDALGCCEHQIHVAPNVHLMMTQALTEAWRHNKRKFVFIYNGSAANKSWHAIIKRRFNVNWIVVDYSLLSESVAMRQIEKWNVNNLCVIADIASPLAPDTFPWPKLWAKIKPWVSYSIVICEKGIGLKDCSSEAKLYDVFITSTSSWSYSGSNAAVGIFRAGQRFEPRIIIPDLPDPGPDWQNLFTPPKLDIRSALGSFLAAKQYIESIGGATAVSKYQNELADQARKHLLKAWDLPDDVGTRDAGSPVFAIQCPFQPPSKMQATFAAFMREELISEHKILIAFVVFHDVVYMRFSAAIYLELEDFQLVIPHIDEVIFKWKNTVSKISWITSD